MCQNTIRHIFSRFWPKCCSNVFLLCWVNFCHGGKPVWGES